MADPSSIQTASRPGGDANIPPHRYTAKLAGEIEGAWQSRWDESGVFQTPNPTGDLSAGFDRVKDRPKLYVLDMFPYPSGVGLHVGHPLGYIATDIFARFKRMTGHNVLHVMGYDAFGLPAEQYAVQTGTHPRVTTENNIASMREQLHRLGLAHDRRRSVATTDVSFYRWTQWIFLQIYNAWHDETQNKARPIDELVAEFESGDRPPVSEENPQGKTWSELDELTRRKVVDSHRLVYLKEQAVNWCPALGTVLANEEVTAEGKSERGNHPVYRRPLKQWVMRITAYADRLLADLDDVDWPEPVKQMQRHWIGKSEGAYVDFPLESGLSVGPIRVFTTRPDTIFGATYMVLSPEHPLVDTITPETWPDSTSAQWKGADASATPAQAVAKYREQAARKSDLQRQAESKEKTGVFTGAYAINPASGERMAVFIADYVLMGYGSGAIMAVPAHDDRDFEFAQQFDLKIRDVVHPAPIRAIAWFFEHVEQPKEFSQGWDGAMADFVALATENNYKASVYPDLLDRVRSRRNQATGAMIDPLSALPSGEEPGGVGERRGVVQKVWLETLSDIVSLGFDHAKSMFADGSLYAMRGAAFTDPGIAVNSEPINGRHTLDAKETMIQWLEQQGVGGTETTYKLRDWLFSRQRYWGEPFPIVYDEDDLPIALPESMLPVELPELTDYAPEATDDPDAPPRPPLGRAKEWVTVDLDLGEGVKTYRRELNTMPQWAGSCWYYLRYLDPHNDDCFCDPAIERYWMQGAQGESGGVDLYVGGVEHAVLHLLYARFWHKVLFDLGRVSTIEPFHKLFNQGYIQAPAYTDQRGVYVEANDVVQSGDEFLFHGQPVKREFGKMGKSLKNAITPDDIGKEFGADTLRLYEMYMGPLEQSKPWNPRDIIGMHRFLQKVWRHIVDEETGEGRVVDDPAPMETRRRLHKTIAGVRADCEHLMFNTAIAKLNQFNNHLTSVSTLGGCPREAAEALTLMLAPLTPHIADELWRRLGHDTPSAMLEPYPVADPSLLVDDEVEIAVQILGKVRGRIVVAVDADEKTIEDAALADPYIAGLLAGKTVRKVIVVPGRLVNIVAN